MTKLLKRLTPQWWGAIAGFLVGALGSMFLPPMGIAGAFGGMSFGLIAFIGLGIIGALIGNRLGFGIQMRRARRDIR